jgi:hypothetical protein
LHHYPLKTILRCGGQDGDILQLLRRIAKRGVIKHSRVIALKADDLRLWQLQSRVESKKMVAPAALGPCSSAPAAVTGAKPGECAGAFEEATMTGALPPDEIDRI